MKLKYFCYMAICYTILFCFYLFNIHSQASRLIHHQLKNAGLLQFLRLNGISTDKMNEYNSINRSINKFGQTFSLKNNFMNIFNETGENIKADCVTLRLLSSGVNNSKICIYNTTDDVFVSGSLRTSGQWESGNLHAFGQILSSNPDLLVLDVGCQVGTYTLYANKIGAKVIAVDAFKTNLELLSKSLHFIHQEDNVILLWNAMVSHHGKLILGFYKGNIGGTYVRNETDETKRPEEANYAVQGLKFDDLVDTFELDNKKVFIKIDIEGSELDAFYGGHEFFRRVNVCYMIMEFVTYAKNGKGHLVLDFLKTYGLYPYSDPNFKNSLEGAPPSSFKFDVYFTRKDGLCTK